MYGGGSRVYGVRCANVRRQVPFYEDATHAMQAENSSAPFFFRASQEQTTPPSIPRLWHSAGRQVGRNHSHVWRKLVHLDFLSCSAEVERELHHSSLIRDTNRVHRSVLLSSGPVTALIENNSLLIKPLRGISPHNLAERYLDRLYLTAT